MPANRDRLSDRIAFRRRGEQGLTLIELLLSLAIVAVLTAFLAGGLSMGRRAFSADRASQIGSETSAAIQTISGLIASALPVRFDRADQKDGAGFAGRRESLSFVGLSEGRSLRGGPYRIILRRIDNDVVVEFTPFAGERPRENSEPMATSVVALSGVREIHISYFGSTDVRTKPAWRSDWPRSERLPNLVSVRIEFEDERRNEPASIVALRQA